MRKLATFISCLDWHKITGTLFNLLAAMVVFGAGFSSGVVWSGGNLANPTAGVCGNNGGTQQVAVPTRWSDLQTAKSPDTKPSWTAGNPSGMLVQVFLDYQCPYSQQYIASNLSKLLERSDLKIEVYDLPLDIHPNAISSAAGVRCAAAQGKAYDYLKGLIAANPEVSQVVETAGESGLNMEQFNACLVQAKKDAADSAAAAGKVGISGTPTTIINGRVFAGMSSWGNLVNLIDTAKK